MLKWSTRLVSRRGVADNFRLLIKVWESTATGDSLVLQGSEYLQFGSHDASAVFEDGDVAVSLTVRFHDFPERASSTTVEQVLAAHLAGGVYGSDMLHGAASQWANVSYEWQGVRYSFDRVDASAEAEGEPQWGVWRCDALKLLVVAFRHMMTSSDTWTAAVGAQVRLGVRGSHVPLPAMLRCCTMRTTIPRRGAVHRSTQQYTAVHSGTGGGEGGDVWCHVTTPRCPTDDAGGVAVVLAAVADLVWASWRRPSPQCKGCAVCLAYGTGGGGGMRAKKGLCARSGPLGAPSPGSGIAYVVTYEAEETMGQGCAYPLGRG